jgi:hypothetical protein
MLTLVDCSSRPRSADPVAGPSKQRGTVKTGDGTLPTGTPCNVVLFTVPEDFLRHLHAL